MQTKIDAQVKPFPIPSNVEIILTGTGKETTVNLSDLKTSTLEMLCDHFRESVFKHANKAGS